MSSVQIEIIKGRRMVMESNNHHLLAVVEYIFRMIFLPIQIISLLPLLWVLYSLEIIPKNVKPQKNNQHNKILSLLISTPIWLPWLFITLFTIDFMALLIDYFLYKIETEELLKITSSTPSKGVKHSYETWLSSRYVQSLLFAPFYDMRDYELLLNDTKTDKRYFLKNGIPKRKLLNKILTLKGRPHRQFNERIIDCLNNKKMNNLFDKQLFAIMDNVCIGPSVFEGLGANAAKFCDLTKCASFMKSKHGEFAHIHTCDGSWHCRLSPIDATIVVKNGWGEIWPNYIIYPHIYNAPYILLFASRNDDDLNVIKQILTASYEFCKDQTKDN